MGNYAVTANGNIPISGYSHTGGGVVQTSYSHVTTITSRSLTINSNISVTEIQTSITLTSASNGVLIYARWSGEVDNLWNVMWGLERNGTYLTDPGNTPGSRGYGVLPGGDCYAAAAENNGSTPAMVDFWWYDEPGSLNTLTYTLTCRSATGTVLYINRTFSDTNNNVYQRMTSGIMLWEIAR